MRFTIKGSRNGSRVQVTWTDGVLTGDPPTLDLLAVEAELASSNPGDVNGQFVVPTGGQLKVPTPRG